MSRRTRLLFATEASSLAAATLVATYLAAAASSGVNSASADIYRTPLKCNASPTHNQLLGYRAPKAKKPYTIAVMQVSLAAYYYQALAWAAERAAKHASNGGNAVTVIHTAGKGYTTPALQLQQAENLLQKGVDAVVLAPVDIQGSVPVVRKFKAAGIPVVNVSTEVADPYPYTVMQDDYRMGLALGELLHKLLPRGGEGVYIAGPGNASWSRKRTAGFEDAVKKYANIKIVAKPSQLVDPAAALRDFENAAEANPDVKWLGSGYYLTPLPDSLPSKYKGITYVTTSYEPTSIAALKKGSLKAVLPTSATHMGYLGVARAVELLNGQKAPKVTCIGFPPLTKASVGSKVANAELYPSKTYKASTGG